MRDNFYKILFLGLLLAVNLSGTTFAFEPITGQGEGLGNNIVLSNSSASMLAQVPTGGLKPGGWLFETGYSRQYNLSDFDQLFLASAVRVGDFIFSGEASSFGSADYYGELTGRFMLAYCFDSLVIGGNVSGQLLQFGNGYENLSAVGIGFGMSYRMKQYLLSITADNINSPTFYETSSPVEAVYSAYGEYRGQSSFSILAHMSMEANQKNQIGFGQRISVSESGAIIWGVETEPMKYGAGFEVDLVGGRFAYSFSIHPVLGLSHVMSISSGNVNYKRKIADDFE